MNFLEEYKWVSKLLRPVGYQLLVRPYQARTKIGSIILPDQTKDMDRVACTAGQVLAMGAEAYKDPQKFVEGPWCKVGDWVVLSRLAGARFTLQEPDGEQAEYRLLNDDAIVGITEEPEKIDRIRL